MTRGQRVRFARWREDAGMARTERDGAGVGTVLDRTDVRGEWWVMPSGTARAVRVLAKDMTPAATMHGAR